MRKMKLWDLCHDVHPLATVDFLESFLELKLDLSFFLWKEE
jgi:hypothetical protein